MHFKKSHCPVAKRRNVAAFDIQTQLGLELPGQTSHLHKTNPPCLVLSVPSFVRSAGQTHEKLNRNPQAARFSFYVKHACDHKVAAVPIEYSYLSTIGRDLSEGKCCAPWELSIWDKIQHAWNTTVRTISHTDMLGWLYLA